jgi:hypothetical protein
MLMEFVASENDVFIVYGLNPFIISQGYCYGSWEVLGDIKMKKKCEHSKCTYPSW